MTIEKMKHNAMIFAALLLSLPLSAQPMDGMMMPQGGMPMPQGGMMPMQQPHELTYQEFVSQPGVEVHKAYFTIYQKNDRFCLEIPQAALGRDILVSAQVVRGYGSYVSPSSDIVRFELADKQRLFMRRNRSIDAQRDSSDVAMAEAISNSAMLPIDRTLTIMTRGEHDDSYIVDITADINQATGLFDVSKMNTLSHPDASRSGVSAIQAIQDGVAVSVYRSQTDNMAQGSSSNMQMQDVAVTVGLEFIIQLLPEHRFQLKPAAPAFGFRTITRQEYDTRRYDARRREYVCRWDMSRPVTIALDPSTPALFRQSIKDAVAQWETALRAAGVKTPFRLSDDETDRHLGYGTIYVCWGNAFAGVNSTAITNPLTGEIIAARLNLQDRSIDDLAAKYWMQYRAIDRRVAKDQLALDMRRDLLTAEVAAELGRLLGLKDNWRGGSVTAPLRFDYRLANGSGAKATQLFPRVSAYDADAIRYAYGKGKNRPAAKAHFYSAEDKANPWAQQWSLPGDVLTNCRQAIDNVKQNYATLHRDISRLPGSQSNYAAESKAMVLGLGLVGDYMQQIASLVGGRQQWPVIKGVSETPTTYVPRSEQLAALRYLEQELLGTFPTWMMRPELLAVTSANPRSMTIGTANAVLTQLLSADVLQRLAEQERALGSEAYTAAELLAYVERLVFQDFDASKPLDDVRQKEQINLMLKVAEYVQQHNIVMGMQNEGNCLLQVWLVETGAKIRQLAKSHADEATRQHYDLLAMRLDRSYFNKTVQ